MHIIVFGYRNAILQQCHVFLKQRLDDCRNIWFRLDADFRLNHSRLIDLAIKSDTIKIMLMFDFFFVILIFDGLGFWKYQVAYLEL